MKHHKKNEVNFFGTFTSAWCVIVYKCSSISHLLVKTTLQRTRMMPFLFPNQLESAIRHYDLTVPMEKKYCMSVDFSMKDFYCY